MFSVYIVNSGRQGIAIYTARKRNKILKVQIVSVFHKRDCINRISYLYAISEKERRQTTSTEIDKVEPYNDVTNW